MKDEEKAGLERHRFNFEYSISSFRFHLSSFNSKEFLCPVAAKL